jgi:uncharacterized protein
MFIKIKDLELRNLEFDESFAPGVIELGEDLEQKVPLQSKGRAELIREHRGGKNIVEDIRLVAKLATEITTHCARCLEPVENQVSEAFDLIYRPLGVDAAGDESSINAAETEIGYYEGDGLLLEDVLKEQVLLALPVKQVCKPNCKGLCPQCGTNLNTGKCDCVAPLDELRWAALKDIREKLER